MNKIVKDTIIENKHVLILALLTSICFISCMYYECMYQSMFQGQIIINPTQSWYNYINFYGYMVSTMFYLGTGFCLPMGYFLGKDIIVPMIRGN